MPKRCFLELSPTGFGNTQGWKSRNLLHNKERAGTEIGVWVLGFLSIGHIEYNLLVRRVEDRAKEANLTAIELFHPFTTLASSTTGCNLALCYQLW